MVAPGALAPAVAAAAVPTKGAMFREPPTAAASPTAVFPRLGGKDVSRVRAAGANLHSVLARLHLTYAHPGFDRLLRLLKDAGCDEPGLAPALRRITEQCATCR